MLAALRRRFAALMQGIAMQNQSLPDLSIAWSLSDAAGLFTSPDDEAAIGDLDRQIEQISDQILWLASPAPWPAMQQLPEFDFPGATTAEEEERTAQGWTYERIERWMFSRHAWVSTAGHYPHLFSEAEVISGSLRDDWTREAAQTAVEEAAARRREELQGEIEHLRHRRRCVATKGLLVALKSGAAVAHGRAGSLRSPIARITTKTWMDDELVLDLDRRAVALFTDEQASVFCDVRILSAVPIAPKRGRQREEGANLEVVLRQANLLDSKRGMSMDQQHREVRRLAKEKRLEIPRSDCALTRAINRARSDAKVARAEGGG